MKVAIRNKQSHLAGAVVVASLSLAVAGTCLVLPNNALATSTINTTSTSSATNDTGTTVSDTLANADKEETPVSYVDGRSITVSPNDLLEDFERNLETHEGFKYETVDTSYESTSCYEITESDARVGRIYFGTWDESVPPTDMDTVGIDLNMTLALDRVNPNIDAHTNNAFLSLIMACDLTLTPDDALEIAQEAYEQGQSVRNGLKYTYAIDDEYVWLKTEVYHGVEPKWLVWYEKEKTAYHGLLMDLSLDAEVDFGDDYIMEQINYDIIYRFQYVDEFDEDSYGWTLVSIADEESMDSIISLKSESYTKFGAEQVSNKELDVFVSYYYSKTDASTYGAALLVRSEDHAWSFVLVGKSISGFDEGFIDAIRQLAYGLEVGDLTEDKGSLLA